MKATRFSVFALFTILFFPVFLNAQQPARSPTATVVPRLVSFSGKAVDAQGKPLSGIAGVTFTIYKGQYDGAPLWMETQNVQADSKGTYSIQLGATKSDGLPVELFASGEARWLGVRVNGGEEQPRVMLLSVPYALKAGDAATIGGLPPSAFVLAGSSQSGAIESSIDAATSNPVPGVTPAASTVTTSGGTINALPLWTTATNVQSSAITQTGSGATAKIGIGTAVPAAALDIKGGEYVRGALTLPAIGIATATAGKNSQPQDLIASSFSSLISTGVNQKFQWQAEPAANDTANPSGTLNLLYGLGATTPAETGLKLAPNGQITFATGQKFPGTGAGTITGVTTASGSGLVGGGTSGNLKMALTNTCANKQTLMWNGSAWVCSALAIGSVTSVGVTAPAADFTVSGSPVTSAGTLGLKWNVAPTSANTANAIVKRDASGNFSAHQVVAVNQTVGNAVGSAAISGQTLGNDGVGVSGDGPDIGVSGTSLVGTGVLAQGSTGVNAQGSGYGVTAQSPNIAVYGDGGTYGLRGVGGEYGVYGTVYDGGSAGVYGAGTYGVYGQGNQYGVFGSSNSWAVWGESFGADGVHGVSHTGGGSGVGAINDAGGDGIFAEASNGGFAGFFLGDVDVDGNLSKAAGSFKIDHPLDPSEKYLYHSFVESPDMKNIYDGKVTTDAEGNAVVTMPEWFEALNRDFRYQLTVIGQFAQAIVADEIANGRFTIKTDKPNVKVSWQVTGIRQDAWANAHRIPVEQVKPEKERGSYLHPELFGAPEEKSIAWARHPDTMKRAKEMRSKPSQLPSLPASEKR